MIVHAEDIEKRLKKVWPKIKDVWLTSHNYFLPSIEQLKKMVTDNSVKKYSFKHGKGECEFFSLVLHASIKTAWLSNNTSNETIAFGECMGLNVETSHDRVHKCNICITQEKIILIEPQTNQLIYPSSEIKNGDPNFIFYITM